MFISPSFPNDIIIWQKASTQDLGLNFLIDEAPRSFKIISIDILFKKITLLPSRFILNNHSYSCLGLWGLFPIYSD